MFFKLKKIHDKFNVSDLNNLLLVISLIPLIISLYITNNIFVIIMICCLVYLLSTNLKNNKYIRFLSNFLGIFILGYLFLKYLDLSFINFDIKNIYLLFIKILLLIDYLLIVFISIKNKKLKIIKNKQRKLKKYTFKDLRKEKREIFKKENILMINEYIKNNNIKEKSDYYKVINDNLENKISYNLEEYVWINYLRFYKNKRFNKRNIFDKMNFVFLVIHVIILLLAILLNSY